MASVTGERTGPLPRPANRQNHAASGGLQVVIRPGVWAIAGFSRVNGGRKISHRGGIEGALEWFITVCRHIVPMDPVEDKFRAVRARYVDIKSLNLLQNGGW